MDVIYHADDFGLSVDQSYAILSCSSACGGQGVLNSTSAIVTSPAFSECAQLIRPFVQAGSIKLGLHLNLVEGAPRSDAADVPDLINERGVFARGFAGLMMQSRGWKKGSDQYDQLCLEVRNQLKAFLSEFPEMRDRLRVDSHQHFHLIPAVFDALMLAIREEGCTLEYLRIPAEPTGPFASTPALYSKYPPINWVKNGLLNALWLQNKSKLPDYQAVSAVFCGLVLSGRMEYVAQAGLLDAFKAFAQKKGMALEVLFHPGGMASAQDCLDPELEGFVDFYLSDHRGAEARALRELAS